MVGIHCPTVDEVLEIYAEYFGCTSQHARHYWLRDEFLLEMALERPRTYAFYRRADLALQAAVLVHGIAEQQVFREGNKRMAALTVRYFLELNGHRLELPPGQLAGWILELARL